LADWPYGKRKREAGRYADTMKFIASIGAFGEVTFERQFPNLRDCKITRSMGRGGEERTLINR